MGTWPNSQLKERDGEENLEGSVGEKEEKVEGKRLSPLKVSRGPNESCSSQIDPQEEGMKCGSEFWSGVEDYANLSGKSTGEGVTSSRRERQIGGICGTSASVDSSVVVGGAMSEWCSSPRLKRHSLPQWLVCHYYHYGVQSYYLSSIYRVACPF